MIKGAHFIPGHLYSNKTSSTGEFLFSSDQVTTKIFDNKKSGIMVVTCRHTYSTQDNTNTVITSPVDHQDDQQTEE